MLKRVSPRAANGTGRAGLTFGVLLCIFCVAAYAVPPVTSRQPSDPAGRYTYAARLPAAMKDFDSINLLAVDGHPGRVAGEVVVKRSAAAPLIYKIVPTSLSGEKLTFRTQITGGSVTASRAVSRSGVSPRARAATTCRSSKGRS